MQTIDDWYTIRDETTLMDKINTIHTKLNDTTQKNQQLTESMDLLILQNQQVKESMDLLIQQVKESMDLLILQNKQLSLVIQKTNDKLFQMEEKNHHKDHKIIELLEELRMIKEREINLLLREKIPFTFLNKCSKNYKL